MAYHRGIQNIITTGYATLPVAIFLSIIGWLFYIFFLPHPLLDETSYSLWSNLDLPTLSLLVKYIFNFLIFGVVGYFLFFFHKHPKLNLG